jgi:hypothetical protein
MISILQIGTGLSRCLLLFDHLVHLPQHRVDALPLHAPQVRRGLLGMPPQVPQEHGAIQAPGHGEPGGQAVAAKAAAVALLWGRPHCTRSSIH